MKKLNYIYIVLCLLVFSQCQPPPLDLKLDEFEPGVVVASQVLPGEVMFIGLTRSFTALSNAGNNGGGDSADFANILVDSARVTITHNGDIDTLVKLAPGLFASIKTLDDPGTIYTLNVHDYGLGKSVSATAEMLAKVEFDTIYPVVTKAPEDTSVVFKAEFTDNPSERNFYMINIYSRHVLDEGLDLNSFFENGSNKVETTRIFSDQDLTSGLNKLDIDVSGANVTDSIAVALSNISEEYYDFLKKREKGSNIFAKATNEPINYQTNVKDGYGFFTTHFPDVHYFDLNEH